MGLKIKREVKVGVFAVLMLLALYWGINFLKGRDPLSRNHRYYTSYEQVSGLQPSSAIVIKGFKVGSVSKISYDPARSDKIVLQLTIRNKFKIPTDSRAHVFSDGLLGGKGIEIELGESGYYLNDGDTLRSSMEPDLLEVAGSEFETIKRKANALFNQVSETLTYVNLLLSKNTDNIAAATGNLAEITAALREVSVTESHGLKDIVHNLSSLSAKLDGSADKLDVALAGIGGAADSIRMADIPALVRSLDHAATQLGGAVEKLNGSEGTAGRLLNDPALYESLARASDNLDKLLADIKAHPGRYVSVSVFGRRER